MGMGIGMGGKRWKLGWELDRRNEGRRRDRDGEGGVRSGNEGEREGGG